MKIALVYDRVNKWGGAERVLEALHKTWPEAPLYTSVYNLKTASWAKSFKVIPSFLQNFPLAKKHHEFFSLLMPVTFESFNFEEYDVVISVTSEAAKGIVTKPGTLHICYCLTPTRYLWSGYENYFTPSFLKILSAPVVTYLQAWDKIAAQRPDCYLAISKNVQKRIKKYYGRDSELIYPPIDLKKFQISTTKLQKTSKLKVQNSNYFLLVSRLVSYKRVDIAIEAFNRLELPLKIIGTGSQMKKLREMAKKNIEFLGQLTDKELLSYYQESQAVVFPQEEDFGLVPLEAQACGKPVIAYRGGGALETINEGRTGLFFYPQTAEALFRVVKLFRPEKFNPEDCRENAEKFDQKKFRKKLKKLVEEKWKNTLN